MEDEGHVLVVGAAGLDIKGRPNGPLKHVADNPGRVWNNYGGVGRNIAENLARLEVNTIMLTVVGNDMAGDMILAHTAAAGVDVVHALQVDGQQTGSFVTILDEDGEMALAINDYDATKTYLTPGFLYSKEMLFAGASYVAIDLNLSEDTIRAVVDLCQQHHVPLCVDPTSSVRAPDILPYLDRVFMIAPNASETTALCGLDVAVNDIDTAVHVAKHFTQQGVNIAIVKVGAKGMIYADGQEGGHIEARKTRVVDPTGAGDALFATVLFGMINGLQLDESLRLGAIAASFTLQSKESVLPDLTPDLLYDHL